MRHCYERICSTRYEMKAIQVMVICEEWLHREQEYATEWTLLKWRNCVVFEEVWTGRVINGNIKITHFDSRNHSAVFTCYIVQYIFHSTLNLWFLRKMRMKSYILTSVFWSRIISLKCPYGKKCRKKKKSYTFHSTSTSLLSFKK